MTKLKALLIASVMVSMGASDAFAGRGTNRAPVRSVSQQRANRSRARQAPRQPRQQRLQQQQQRVSQNGISAHVKNTIASYKDYMVNQAIANNATPPFFLIPHSATMSQTRQGDYKKSITPAYSVSNASGGKLDVTALLPVSAHTGQAQQFAKSNQYNITITHADGTRETIPKVASTGLVTEKVLSIQLKPGKTVVNFWPDGSGGVGGFKAGREIELNYGGQ